MQLIGMLDSPYVRRVAVSLQLLGLPFEHRSISVFRGMEQFKLINPVLKAPSLICDDGTVLMDSGLIIEYAEALAAPRSLMPSAIADRQRALRLIGLAMAACEKSVQIVYEHNVRPAEKVHAPWMSRVHAQLAAALGALEASLAAEPLVCTTEGMDQAGATCAVVWHFVHAMQPELSSEATYPALHAHSLRAEALPAFSKAPHGEGIVQR